MKKEVAIRCQNLGIAYYRNHKIINELSTEIFASEFVAIIGPNGSGKSTFLKTLCGWLKKNEGLIELFGNDIEKLSAFERASLIGMVPQVVEMPLPLTVREIVMIGRTRKISRWYGSTKSDEKIVECVMKQTDTAFLADKLFSELSGGEKQRVLIAMVLAQEPRIILLDEATAHLDINHAIEVMQIIKKLNQEKGITIVMASHDMNIASLFADRIFVMKQGSIVCSGTPAEVLTPQNIKDFYSCNVETYKKDDNVYVLPLVAK